MAAISLFPSNFFPPPSTHHHHCNHRFLLHINHRNRRLQCRSPIICAASAGNSRASRKPMSDAELCDGLRQFLASAELPDGHVPSTKELTQHGRKDLANIVRRRGYKLIKELLENSTGRETDGADLKENGIIDNEEDSMGQDKKARYVSDFSEDVSMMIEVSEHNSVTIDEMAVTRSDQDSTSVESPVDSSLLEKVSKFMKWGKLDEDEDYLANISKVNGSKGYKTYIGNCIDEESMDLDGADLQHLSSSNHVDVVMNGNVITLEHSASPTPGKNQTRDFISSPKLPPDIADSECNNLGNQADIDHLRFKLHLKELELSRLKEQLEKEKEALSILHRQAENDIGKAEKIVSEIDVELQSVEESLSDLKEVQIQYWGEGEIVEVAGSFNGWHQRIKMDLKPSPAVVDADESRTCWFTTLWLYPGVYEIKFIVDGQWRIDPQRESITRCYIENNILHVVR
ncbi:hypothetical protein Dimus_007121 [Dionaea muscipula]